MSKSVWTVEAKLNKEDKNFRKYVLIFDIEEGIILIDKGFYIITFESLDHARAQGVQMIKKKYIGEADL